VQKIGWIQRLISKKRLFVVGIFVFSAVVHLPYLAPGGPSPSYNQPLSLQIDEGTVLYDSFRVTCGEVIYRDFFQFQGPVFYHIYAGLFTITGPSLAAARALNLFVTGLSATFIALLVAPNLGLLAGAMAAAIHICLLVPMWPYAYPHWLAEALALAGIYLLATSNGRARRELAGGACIGLSAATIQSLGLPILATCMAALAMPGIAKRSWKETCLRPLRVFAGALLSVAPFIFYLGIRGAFDQMWYTMFEWVFKHYPEGQKDAAMLGYGAYLESHIISHARVSWPWRDLAVISLRFIKLLPLFAVLGAITTTMQAVIDTRRRSLDYGYLVIGTASIAGTAPLLLGITRVDMVHIAFVGSFGLCGAALALQPLVTWKPRFRLPVAIAWVFVGILTIANFSAKTVMTYRPSRAMEGWRGEIINLGMGRWIDTNLGPDERIVTALGGLQYLYIRRAAVGFTFLPQGTPRYYSDEQWRKLGGQILKALPPVIEITVEQWLQLTERTPELKQLYEIIAFGYKRDSPQGSGSQRSASDTLERLLLRLSQY
jgi:hypothetical protein